MTNIFYYDNVIKDYENKFDYNSIIQYLEELYNNKKNSELLTTLIASAWFYFIEGDINNNVKNYDKSYFLKKWKQYVDIGLENYCNDVRFTCITGYTLSLHGFFINTTYEKLGKELLQVCAKLEKDDLSLLAEHFSSLYYKNTYREIVDVLKNCDKWFPSNSLLDCYFKDILTKSN